MCVCLGGNRGDMQGGRCAEMLSKQAAHLTAQHNVPGNGGGTWNVSVKTGRYGLQPPIVSLTSALLSCEWVHAHIAVIHTHLPNSHSIYINFMIKSHSCTQLQKACDNTSTHTFTQPHYVVYILYPLCSHAVSVASTGLSSFGKKTL